MSASKTFNIALRLSLSLIKTSDLVLSLTCSRITRYASLFSNYNVYEFLSSRSPVQTGKLPPPVLKGMLGKVMSIVSKKKKFSGS